MVGTVIDVFLFILGLSILFFLSLFLLRRDCLWLNFKFFSRWVRASFCWIVIRNKVFRVFFLFFAVVNCFCILFNCVIYLLYLEFKQKSGQEKILVKLNLELKLKSNELYWNLDVQIWFFQSRMEVIYFSRKLEIVEQV